MNARTVVRRQERAQKSSIKNFDRKHEKARQAGRGRGCCLAAQNPHRARGRKLRGVLVQTDELREQAAAQENTAARFDPKIPIH